MSDTDPTELRTHVLWELALGENSHTDAQKMTRENTSWYNKTKYKTPTHICRSGINLSQWSYIPCIALHMQRMWDVALKLDIFANEEGKVICNGNVLSHFGISTNYQGQDQIPIQIWKLSSKLQAGMREQCSVLILVQWPKRRGILVIIHLQKFHDICKNEERQEKKKKRIQILSSPKPREHWEKISFSKGISLQRK